MIFFKRILVLIVMQHSVINFGMQKKEEESPAAKMRSFIAKEVSSSSLCLSDADYKAILNYHLEKLQECPLYQRANFYMITYMGKEWSMYVPSK